MKKSSPTQWVIRVLIYIFGLFCLAIGVALSINADLGVSPVNSLPYVISLVTGQDMGRCVIVVFSSYIVLQILILRRRFRPINLLQIVFSTIFGYFVDLAKLLVGDFALPGYAGRMVMLLASIVLVALGVLLYVEVFLVPMPMEGLAMTIGEKCNIPFPKMKMIVDCVVVASGIALSFLALHQLAGIREGTVITALVTGKLITWMKKPLSPLLKQLCFGEKADTAVCTGTREIAPAE